jgi:2-methylcitrate dehydratase
MVYIIATLLRKAFEKKETIIADHDIDEVWKALMLNPMDYSKSAIANEQTRRIMEKIEFQHGGPDYDSKYPEGIPTSIEIKTKAGKTLDSGLVMFPGGHSQNTTVFLNEILLHKFKLLGKLALDQQELKRFIVSLNNIGEMPNEELDDIYDCNIKFAEEPIDDLPVLTNRHISNDFTEAK